MSEKSVAERLQIKPGRIVLFVNAPPGYESILGPVPEGAMVLQPGGQPADVIQVFVANRQELEAELARLRPLLKPGGLLWVTYHKGTSRVKTDINRDSIWQYAATQGWRAVAMISVDDDWAALRLSARQ